MRGLLIHNLAFIGCLLVNLCFSVYFRFCNMFCCMQKKIRSIKKNLSSLNTRHPTLDCCGNGYAPFPVVKFDGANISIELVLKQRCSNVLLETNLFFRNQSVLFSKEFIDGSIKNNIEMKLVYILLLLVCNRTIVLFQRVSRTSYNLFFIKWESFS